MRTDRARINSGFHRFEQGPFLPSLVCSEVATHECGFAEMVGELWPSEEALVCNAVAKRKREFQVGRHCARVAFDALGVEPVAILSAPDRTPLWPEGVVGSITHTGTLNEGWAAAAVAETAIVESLGIDAELLHPMAENLWQRVLTQRELGWLGRQPRAERGLWALTFFSAKEAAYKCQYPLTHEFLGFMELELELELETGGFTAVFRREVTPRFPQGASLTGRFCWAPNLILSSVVLLRG